MDQPPPISHMYLRACGGLAACGFKCWLPQPIIASQGLGLRSTAFTANPWTSQRFLGIGGANVVVSVVLYTCRHCRGKRPSGRLRIEEIAEPTVYRTISDSNRVPHGLRGVPVFDENMPELDDEDGVENARFVQLKVKEPLKLEREREIILVLDHFQCNTNLSQVIRTASCFGIRKVIAGGRGKAVPKVTRENEVPLDIELKVHRTLPNVLKKLKAQGYRVVGLEQTSGSHDIHEYRWERKTALVVGNESTGILPQSLALLDDAVEIPLWGVPHSLNAAHAASVALYEYCRQYRNG